MILGVVVLLLKIFGVLALLLILKMIYGHYKNMRMIDFYEAQGIKVLTNSRKFILGNLMDLVEFQKIADK